MGEATLRTRSPKFHPGLVAVRELDAGRFEGGAHGLHVLARDERLADATLRPLDGMRRNSRLLSDRLCKFGVAPPEQLSRGPDLLAGDHFAALRDFRRSVRLGRSRSPVRRSTSTRRTASGRDGFGSG